MSPGERPGGLGRPLREVIAAGDDEGDRLSVLFSGERADAFLDDVVAAALNLLSLALPTDLCASVQRAPDAGPVVRMRRPDTFEDDALETATALAAGRSAGRAALIEAVEAGPGRITLAVLRDDQDFDAAEKAMFSAVCELARRVVALRAGPP